MPVPCAFFRLSSFVKYEVQIPAFVPASQQAAQGSIYTAVEALVPEDIRAALETRRAEYVAEQGE